jgi:hypothetical protein
VPAQPWDELQVPCPQGPVVGVLVDLLIESPSDTLPGTRAKVPALPSLRPSLPSLGPSFPRPSEPQTEFPCPQAMAKSSASSEPLPRSPLHFRPFHHTSEMFSRYFRGALRTTILPFFFLLHCITLCSSFHIVHHFFIVPRLP